MGKITTKELRDKGKHVPLFKDIASEGGHLKTKENKKKYKKPVDKNDYNHYDDNNDGNRDEEDDKNDEFILDAQASRRVLQLAREQQEEIENEENRNVEATKPRFQLIHHDSDDDDEAEVSENEEEYYGEDGENYDDDNDDEVDDKDVALFEAYFKSQDSNPFGSVNLADKIMEKINEKEAATKSGTEDFERQSDKVFLPPRVIEAYEKVGDSLRAWTHGKLPKLFKVLPTIKNWEDLIYVTNPETWTPNAVYEATRLFVSNLSANKAERFVFTVLYPRFRQDIDESESNKLNYHIYRAIRKSLYKPAAFFKGFLFPLVEDQCTLQEAMITASVLSKSSIPVQHASVALSWLLEREFSPAATVFIRVLVEKKYALPYQTIDDLVFYFMKFRVITDQSNDNDVILDDDQQLLEQRKLRQAAPMPLVWHKAFLSFAQRYKNDITDDQRDFLMEVIRQRGHKQIGPEIRRELLAGKNKEILTEKKEVDDIMAYF